MKTILVIPDSHFRPGNDLRRATALSNFIIDKTPDEIVCIGDFADIASLCKYDAGTVAAEGRRYGDDIAVANEALDLICNPVLQYSDKMRQLHRKRYEPNWHITLGNHENRIIRAANENPALYGYIGVGDINFRDYRFNVVPFLTPLVIENVAFQHYFTSGVMGRPIGGKNAARALLDKNFMSSVAGHSHERSFCEDTDVVGRKRFGLVVGCYDEGTLQWTTESDRYWRGLVMLHEVHDGQAEPAFFSLNYVLREYL